MRSTVCDFPITNIQEIDAQHFKILECTNDLQNENRPEYEKKIMDRILRCAILHSISEDTLLDEYEYPESGKHQRNSKEFLIDLLLFNKSSDGYIYSKHEYIAFVNQWLLDHIQFFDKKFAFFLKSNKSIKNKD